MKIGVISDTHGFLDPNILELFAGVEHILHAGDIGFASIILELEGIAPVTAVIGNTDGGISFKETEVLALAGRKFLVHHIVNPLAPGENIRTRIEREQPDVVVFGHTHKPFCETIGGPSPRSSVIGSTNPTTRGFQGNDSGFVHAGGILFFNPGYSGKPKFGAERSVAILHCDEKGIRPEFFRL